MSIVTPALITIASTGALVAAEARGSRAGVWATKPLAAAGFIATALAAGALDSSYGAWILAGLVLSWCGDVLLIPGGAGVAFRAGLLSFLAAHLAYAVAFVVRGIDAGASAWAVLPLAVVAIVVLRWLMPRLHGVMRFAVPGYVIAISAMVALAVGTVALHGNGWILVGALMFFVSDLAVARDRFVSSTFWNRAWGLPLYFGGQLVLALTV